MPLARGGSSTHSTEVHGSSVSQQTVSTITDSVIAGTTARHSHPLDRVHPVVFVDAINAKLRPPTAADNMTGMPPSTAQRASFSTAARPGRPPPWRAGCASIPAPKSSAVTGPDPDGMAVAAPRPVRRIHARWVLLASSMVDLRFQCPSRQVLPRRKHCRSRTRSCPVDQVRSQMSSAAAIAVPRWT
ncbi:transposase [Streptomyces yanii]|uniref:Transposase n=1 Tax=Streptomyces yanii TaxID=78510 RepID=A0ABV5R782_9ACTN